MQSKQFTGVFGKIGSNPTISYMIEYMEEVKRRLLDSLKSYNVVVESIRFDTKVVRENGQQVRVLAPGKWNRVGEVALRIPKGYMEIRYYNKARKETEWHDFADYDYRQKTDWNLFLPHPGNGLLTLDIVLEDTGELSVGMFGRLPRRKIKGTDIYFDIFRTRDHRTPKAHSDNNLNLVAAVEAFVNTYAGTFIRHNPENRHGFGESCTNCRFAYWAKRHDGLEQEEDAPTYSDQGIIINSQFGSYVPQQICSIHEDFPDMDTIMELNEYQAEDHDYFYDTRLNDRGQEIGYRRLSPNEAVIGGRLVRISEIRKQGTAERCGECQFYHKSERKPDVKYGFEVASERAKAGLTAKKVADGARDVYVPRYWTQWADYSRMPVFTYGEHKGKEKWHLAFPGEIDNPYEFMVRGIGGLAVTGTSAIMSQCDPDFVPALEGYSEIDAFAARVCNEVYDFCRNFHDKTDAELDALDAKLQAKPQGLSFRMNRRWDNADAYLTRTILLHQGDFESEENVSEDETEYEGDAE